MIATIPAQILMRLGNDTTTMMEWCRNKTQIRVDEEVLEAVDQEFEIPFYIGDMEDDEHNSVVSGQINNEHNPHDEVRPAFPALVPADMEWDDHEE